MAHVHFNAPETVHMLLVLQDGTVVSLRAIPEDRYTCNVEKKLISLSIYIHPSLYKLIVRNGSLTSENQRLNKGS